VKLPVHLSRFAVFLGLALLVTLAAGSATVRFVLVPKAADYRQELQRLASEALGQPVTIGELAASVAGFYPQLVLKEITVAAKAGPPLHFGRLTLELDPWRSLMGGAPVLAGVGLSQGAVTLQQEAGGGWSVVGLEGGGSRPDWLLATGHLYLRDLQVQLKGASRPGLLALGRASLDLYNAGDRHRLRVRLAPAAGIGRELTMAADLRGDPAGSAWHGRTYVAGAGLTLAGLAEFLEVPVQPLSGRADVQLWLDWEQGRPQRAVARLDWTEAAVRSALADGESRQLAIAGLSGWLDWERQEDGWRIRGRDLSLAVHGRPPRPMNFAVAAGGPAVALVADYLDIGDVRVVADGLAPLSQNWRQALQELAPRGELREVRGYWSGTGGGWAVAAEFQGIGFAPRSGAPGISAAAGRVAGSNRGGALQLSVAQGAAEVPSIFREPVPLDRLQARLQWSPLGSGWRLAVSDLDLQSHGIDLGGRFDLLLPGQAPPSIDLQLRTGPAQVAALKHFLPYGVIPVTSAWLERALSVGRADSVRMVLSGVLTEFPFRAGEGAFEVLVDCHDVDLDYQPQWPPLKGVGARLVFAGPAMTIVADRGTIGGGQIQWARAEVADLEREPWLTVNGEVLAEVPQALGFLAASPLADIPHRLEKFAESAGASRIALGLCLPLVAGLGLPQVDGSASLSAASLRFRQLGQALEGIGGDLHFTAVGLDGHDIRGQFLGAPVTLDLRGDDRDIVVQAAGLARIGALRSRWPSPAWDHFGGETDYRLRLTIPKAMDAADEPFRAELASELGGVEIKLPAPLGKSAGDRVPLRAELELQAGKPTPLKLNYRDLAAELWLAEPAQGFGFRRGRLSLGQEAPPPPEGGGLSAALALPALDASEWYRLWQSQGGTGDGASLASLNLKVAALSWNGRDLGQVGLRLERTGEGWEGEGSVPWGSGRFRYQPGKTGPAALGFDLEQLVLPKEMLADAEAPSEADPAKLPAVQGKSRKLVWHGVDLGSLELQTEPRKDGLKLAALSLRRARDTLKLAGSWTRTGEAQETRLHGTLVTDDLGSLLADFGYAREIRDSPSKMRFALAWPGAPQEAGWDRMRGDLRLNLGRGSVLNVDPGLGRALGMLNLGTLRRLLMLDFSDLFGKGMAYDGMEGAFRLNDGQARSEAFLIDAAAARIFITGRVGLVTKDLDETVVVIPHALASIPVAGALMGGAAVGMAYNFAQRLMGNETVNLASTTYRVRGSWDNPAVERIEGNMPLELINRMWSDVKLLSGFDPENEESEP